MGRARSWGTLLVLGLLLALSLPGGQAQAYKITETEAGDPVSWLVNCRSFYLDPEGWTGGAGQALTAAVTKSIEAWDEVECSDLTLFYGGQVESNKTGYSSCGNNRNEITFRPKWPYMQEAVAYTTLTYLADDGTLVDADIEFNLDDYSLTLYPADNPNSMDLQGVLTHEMGHAVGLDHSSDLDSTMYFSAPPGEVKKRTLTKDDRDGLCQLYPAGSLLQDCEAGENGLVDPYQDLFCDGSAEGSTVGGCGVVGGPGGAGRSGWWWLLVLGAVAWAGGIRLLRARLGKGQPPPWRSGFGRTGCNPLPCGRGSDGHQAPPPWRSGFGRTGCNPLPCGRGSDGLGRLLARTLGAGLGLLVLLLPTQVAAWEFYSSNGNLVHWPAQACSIPYYIGSNGLEEIEGEQEILEVRRAFKAWGDLACSDFYPSFRNLVDDAKVSKLGPNRNDVVFARSGWKWEPTYVMLTVISFDPPTGEIYDVDIAINAQSFDFSLCGGGQDDQLADFKFAFLHEAGHFTGLAHSQVEDSLMYAAGTAVCSADLPAGILEDDEQGFCSVYQADLWKCSDQILPDTVDQDSVADAQPEDTLTPTDTNSGGGGGGGCGVAGSSGPTAGPWIQLLLCAFLAFSLRPNIPYQIPFPQWGKVARRAG